MAIDNRINNMVTELYDIREKKRELEKLEKALVEAIKPLVDPMFDQLPDAPIVAGTAELGVYLNRSARESRTISGDLLLERGVDPSVIAYATKVTKYFRYLTSRPKAKKSS